MAMTLGARPKLRCGLPNSLKPVHQTRQQREKALQADIVNHLSLLGYVCYEFGRPGGRPKCPKCDAWVGRLAGATPSGWPDLMVVKPAGEWPRVMFMEVKTDSGTVEPAQRLRAMDLHDVGFVVSVVRSVEDAERAVRRLP